MSETMPEMPPTDWRALSWLGDFRKIIIPFDSCLTDMQEAPLSPPWAECSMDCFLSHLVIIRLLCTQPFFFSLLLSEIQTCFREQGGWISKPKLWKRAFIPVPSLHLTADKDYLRNLLFSMKATLYQALSISWKECLKMPSRVMEISSENRVFTKIVYCFWFLFLLRYD